MSGGVAKRYVKPLFDVAREKNQLDKVAQDLTELESVLKSSKELRTVLSDPSTTRDLKRSIMEKIFTNISPYSRNFIRVVIGKNRTSILFEANRLYIHMLNDHRGVTTGTITTAAALDDKTFVKLHASLEQKLQRKITLNRGIDPKLIGGALIQVGNTVIDGSVRGQLAKLRKVVAGM